MCTEVFGGVLITTAFWYANLAAVAPLTAATTAGIVCDRAAPMHIGHTMDANSVTKVLPSDPLILQAQPLRVADRC